uniref:Uncharacterized protein n=1 Tax=viral metagenome TaxID=1070528 RepID=A0A6M3L3X2_9ZZZZ
MEGKFWLVVPQYRVLDKSIGNRYSTLEAASVRAEELCVGPSRPTVIVLEATAEVSPVVAPPVEWKYYFNSNAIHTSILNKITTVNHMEELDDRK